jgi:hypothetical protein
LFVGIAGTFLLTYGLVRVMKSYTATPDLTAARAETRAKNLKELHAEEHKTLTEYAWQNKDKGIVRVPIDQATKIALVEWQDPKAARAQMIARAHKLNAAPPAAAAPATPPTK